MIGLIIQGVLGVASLALSIKTNLVRKEVVSAAGDGVDADLIEKIKEDVNPIVVDVDIDKNNEDRVVLTNERQVRLEIKPNTHRSVLGHELGHIVDISERLEKGMPPLRRFDGIDWFGIKTLRDEKAAWQKAEQFVTVDSGIKKNALKTYVYNVANNIVLGLTVVATIANAISFIKKEKE